jgi:hypothetical protein
VAPKQKIYQMFKKFQNCFSIFFENVEVNFQNRKKGKKVWGKVCGWLAELLLYVLRT